MILVLIWLIFSARLDSSFAFDVRSFPIEKKKGFKADKKIKCLSSDNALVQGCDPQLSTEVFQKKLPWVEKEWESCCSLIHISVPAPVPSRWEEKEVPHCLGVWNRWGQSNILQNKVKIRQSSTPRFICSHLWKGRKSVKATTVMCWRLTLCYEE